MKSIRRQLLIPMLIAVMLALVGGGIATYRLVREQTDRLFDYHLQQIALSVRNQSFRSAVGPDEEGLDFVIQVWGVNGVRLYLSQPHSTLPSSSQLGFATVSTPDAQWRVYSVIMDDEVVQVAQPLRVREQLALAVAQRTLLPLILLVPALALLLWFLVGQGVAPLARLARAVGQRSPEALEPLPEREVPQEVQPLVTSLNDLLHRLQGALSAQRAFIADAAHELRTPLAALQLQVQLLERERDEAERQLALNELKRGLQRATHVVAQLLTLARQAPDVAAGAVAEVSLSDLAAMVVAEHAALADDKGIDLGARLPEDDIIVTGEPDALRTLLSNLVTNAIRHVPAGGHVDVAAGRDAGRAFIEVCDDGPGIPPAERERVFARFYRGAEATEHGSGLGLAIVRAIADRHGAEVSLGDAPGGGLKARVSFSARGDSLSQR